MSRLLWADYLFFTPRSCHVGWALALRHHFAVHGAGSAIAAVANTGQTAGGHPAIRAVAGDVPTLLVDHTGPVETAATLVHLAPGPLEVGGAAALPGAVSSHLARAKVLTVARALPVLAAVTQEAREASALGLVALVDGAGAVVGTVARTHLLGAFGARKARGAPARGHAGGGGSASAPVATVFPALVQLTLVACVAGLAAALGLPPRVEEAAATIEALQVTGSRPRSIWWECWRGHSHTGAIVQSLPIGTGADRPTGAQQAEPLTLLAVTGIGHFRLLVLVVQHHVGGMAQAPCQVDQGAVSKLMDLEDTIIDVGDAIDVILKDIDAEGVTEASFAVSSHDGVCAVEPDAADDRELGICPVQSFIVVIHGQACGPLDVVLYQCLPKGPIHRCCFNLGVVPPI